MTTTIEDLEKRVSALEARFAAKPSASAQPHAAPGATADAAELDSKYGDPIVKKSPPRWKGEDIAGRKMSECPPESLDSLAGFLDWKAEKNAAEPDRAKYAEYDRKDAARARGWAARKRDGWKPGGAQPAAVQSDDDFAEGGDIPF